MTVSAVIPTRNRPDSLRRLLLALEAQTRLPAETIVVDASDEPLGGRLSEEFRRLSVRILRTEPSVCRQRNIGIAAATSDLIFLCDDDMEPDPDYIDVLAQHLRQEDTYIVSGWVREKDRDGTMKDLPDVPLRRILWNAVFGLSVWTDLDGVTAPLLLRPVLGAVRRHYRRKGNTLTAAGWPLVTQTRQPVFRTEIFGLGACMARRSLLQSHAFEESLDTRGIGDNYVYLTGLGIRTPVSVITATGVLHHRLSGGAPADPETFARRVLVLDAVRTLRRSSPSHLIPLIWSLCGSMAAFAVRGRWEFFSVARHSCALVWMRRNPYLRTLGRGGSAPPTEAVLPSSSVSTYSDATRNAR